MIKSIFLPRCSVPLLVGLSLLVVCFAKSEKLNFGEFPKSGLSPAAVDPNVNVDDDDVLAAVVEVVVADGVENWNPTEGVAVDVVLPKPGKENPPLVPLDGFIDALPPNIEPFVLFNGVELPKIDEPEEPLKFPKIDGLLSYCVATLGAGDGDSTDVFSSLDVDVCFCNCGWDLPKLVNGNLIFSLELNGVFGAEAVDGVWGAKNNQSPMIKYNQLLIYLMFLYHF